MEITRALLESIEKGDEDFKLYQIKKELQLKSERNARLLLYIIENNPEKWLEKIAKEIKKLEHKRIKEYRKMSKKIESFNHQDTYGQQSKLGKLDFEIRELKTLVG